MQTVNKGIRPRRFAERFVTFGPLGLYGMTSRAIKAMWLDGHQLDLSDHREDRKQLRMALFAFVCKEPAQ